MVLQNDLERLRSAWRALSGDDQTEGWRTIPIEHSGSCHLLAGRHFPGNEEAILIGFSSFHVPPSSHLPQGQGFSVEKVKHEIPGGFHEWVSLSRKSAGSLDMFLRMAEDIIGMLRTYYHAGDPILFHMFLGRIKAWQEFMQRGRTDVLSPEAEVGLFGELMVLKMLIERYLSAPAALESWHGPLDGLHDFLIGHGAVEVKSTVATNGFPVTVGSLEQLDGTLVTPLFLVGIRLSLASPGKTLPELVSALANLFDNFPDTKVSFESMVLKAGFLWAFSDHYKRRFVHIETKFLPVMEDFPALTRNNVNAAIRKVRYEMDMDLACIPEVGLEQVLKELGVI
jgi:hypothetical protein